MQDPTDYYTSWRELEPVVVLPDQPVFAQARQLDWWEYDPHQADMLTGEYQVDGYGVREALPALPPPQGQLEGVIILAALLAVATVVRFRRG